MLSFLSILVHRRFLEFFSPFENMEDSEIRPLCCRVQDVAAGGRLPNIVSVTAHLGLRCPSLVCHSFISTVNIASRNIYISLGACPQLFSYIFLGVENYCLKAYIQREKIICTFTKLMSNFCYFTLCHFNDEIDFVIVFMYLYFWNDFMQFWGFPNNWFIFIAYHNFSKFDTFNFWCYIWMYLLFRFLCQIY